MVKGGRSKNKFIAQSASESEDGEGNLEPSSSQVSTDKKVFDSSEEEAEEMTKEDLEFLKEDDAEDEDELASESEGEISPDDLSDDDLELIEENLGKRRAGKGKAISTGKGGKFKRLRRKNEIESESDGDENLGKGIEERRPSELQNLFNDDDEEDDREDSDSEDSDDLNDFIEEDEDEFPESIDSAIKSEKQRALTSAGIPRRRAIVDDREAPKRALSSALASGQISKQAWDEMMEIFGDGTDYLDMVIDSGDEEERDVNNAASLGVSNVAEETGSADFPERYSELKIEIIEGDADFDAFLQKESVLIAKRLQKLKPVDSFSGLTSAILSVLRFIHHHGLEVPFIATYRKEYFSTFFGVNEIWSIVDDDAKYRQCNQLKKKIAEKLRESEDFLTVSDKEYISEALENEWEESQLQFIQEFLIKRKTVQKQKAALLIEFAHKFAPSAANFAENLKNRRILHGPLILSERALESEAIEVVAREGGNSVEGAIGAAINLLAEEYGSNLQIFAEIRDSILNQVSITVTPTALGSIEISNDPTHYLLPIQYIAEKAVSTFTEEQGLALARGLETKLITVEYTYGKNFEGLLRDLKQYMPGIERITDEVFNLAWSNYWMPRLNRLALQKLRNDAENWVAQFCQFYLLEKLMTPPLHAHCSKLDDDEIAVSSINFVKEKIHLVELDRHGRVLRQDALNTKPNVKFEAILRHSLSPRSAFIVISGQGQECLELYRDLKRSPLYEKTPIIWGCDDTAQIFKTCLRSAREFAECPAEIKYAVSIGRRMLNPIYEFATMADDELLQLPLHPLQAHVPVTLRLRHIHRALVNVINLIGVPINELILPGHKQAILSYVSGLGPQKAAQLFKKIGSKKLQSRAELITLYDMGRRTFTNCAGFIKITGEKTKLSGKKKSSVLNRDNNLIEPLDGTRIHPESYELARKMAADALELDDPSTVQRHQDIFGDDEEESDKTAIILANAIVQIMKEPKKLDDLLLDEYAKEIEKLKHLPKYTTLKEIKAELQRPFTDPLEDRLRIEEVSRLTPINQVLKMLTGRDENWWYIGRPVTIKLLNPTSRGLAYLIDANGLIVAVEGEISRNVRSGVAIHAYLTKIDLGKLMVDVCLKRPENQEEILTQFVRFDPFYDFNRAATEGSANQAGSQRTNGLMKTVKQGSGSESVGQNGSSNRQLSHPAFKALNREDSERLLSLAPIGDFLIRPSSQKRTGGDLPGDLTLTWKVGQGVFAHVPLGEADRVSGQDWNLGKTLMLPALIPGPDGKSKIDKFEDLDEIVGRRIEPVVSLLQEAQACPKYFSNPTSEAINKHLRDQSALNPGRIPYCITLALEPFCGHLMLSHPGGSRQELIRVDPRGYALTDPKSKETKLFERIEKLVDYFKRNYKDFSEKKEPAQSKPVQSATTSNGAASKQQSEDPRSKYQQFAN